MLFTFLPLFAFLVSNTKAHFGAGCPGPFIARSYANCQAMFGSVKGYHCGQIPAPSDAYGACVTAAARYLIIVVTTEQEMVNRYR
jgi:hypothetical protein